MGGKMKRVFEKRERPLLEPTASQLKSAEDAMYEAVCRGNAALVTSSPQHEVTVEIQQSIVYDPLAELAKTSVEDFLSSFRVNGLDCMSTTYSMKHVVDKSTISGTLSTTLPEDVFHLVNAQIGLLDDYLQSKQLAGTEAGDDILVEAILSILRNIWYHQTNYRDTFLTDVEPCIAVANDAMRMLEKLEDVMQEVATKHNHLVWTEGARGNSVTSVVCREAADLKSILSSDAVYASQRAVNFIMQTVQRSDIPTKLFTRDWEDTLVHNEIAVSIVRTFEDYMSDVQNYIEHDFLYHKVVAALVRSTICFYIRCFVNKADQMRRAMKRDFAQKKAQRVSFMNSSRAICRMTYDVEVLRDYFYSVAKESPPLGRLVSNELSVLVILLECMWLAVGRTSADSLEEFVVVVHKQTGADSEVTRHFLSDLWLLMGPKDEHHVVENAVRTMDAELQLVSSRLKQERRVGSQELHDMTCLRLDETLRTLYEDRILQEKSSVCGNFLRDVQLGRSKKGDPHRWRPLKRLLGENEL